MAQYVTPDDGGNYEQLVAAFYREGRPRELAVAGQTWMRTEKDGQMVFLLTGNPEKGMDTNYDRSGSTAPRTPQIDLKDPAEDEPSTKTRKRSKKAEVETE